MNCMRASTVLIALCAAGAGVCAAQQKTASGLPDVTIAPRSSAAVSAQVIDPAKEPAISQKEKLRLIRSRIKYVFVLFLERADGRNRQNPLDAQLLHSVDIGAEVQLRRQDAMPAPMPRKKRDATPLEFAQYECL